MNGCNFGQSHSSKIFGKKKVLEKLIALEKTVAHAMKNRIYFFDFMRIKKLNEVCAKLKRNYDPTGSAVYDERATFSQLNIDLVSLQS